jgi:hypothetical protein
MLSLLVGSIKFLFSKLCHHFQPEFIPSL